MNLQTNHKTALKLAQTKYDYAPYNVVGEGLEAISKQIELGEHHTYTLTIPNEQCGCIDNLHSLVNLFHRKGIKDSTWSGLGDTLKDKITSRRRIDYYRINIQERLQFIDDDHSLGNDAGEISDSEIESLFPELSFHGDDKSVEVTLRIPIF